jgi:tRNA uridine 5-carbamoylmethylation protein Kti12
LDKKSQEVINFIISKQSEVNIGDVIGVPHCAKKYKVQKILSPVELKKLKKDFLNLSKLHPPSSKDKFSDAFLEFLNSSVERE